MGKGRRQYVKVPEIILNYEEFFKKKIRPILLASIKSTITIARTYQIAVLNRPYHFSSMKTIYQQNTRNVELLLLLFIYFVKKREGERDVELLGFPSYQRHNN